MRDSLDIFHRSNIDMFQLRKNFALDFRLGEQLSDEENEILGEDRSGIASDESGEDLFGDDFERYVH